jgi:hypothetical protein
MDGRLADGIAHFNSAAYFEAHEAFEDLWRTAEGDRRLLLQGLTQICAGLVKHQRGQPAPACTLMARGLQKIETKDASRLPELQIPSLAKQVRVILEALDAGAAFTPPEIRVASGDV